MKNHRCPANFYHTAAPPALRKLKVLQVVGIGHWKLGIGFLVIGLLEQTFEITISNLCFLGAETKKPGKTWFKLQFLLR
jgi:hypothetical protein